MHSSFRLIALLSFAAATTAAAQVPATPPVEGRAPGAPAAKLLLSNTGELELTDAQVVRLAAIARRSEARNKTLRAALDSARTRFTGQPGDTAARRQFRQRMQADLQRAQEQARVDERDAIAILTPDQQARAWQMVSARGRGMRARAEMRGGAGRAMRAPRPMRQQRFRPEGDEGRRQSPRAPGQRQFREPRAPRPPIDA